MVWEDRWRQGLQVNVIWYEGRSARGNEAPDDVAVDVDEPLVSDVVAEEEEEEEGGRAEKLGTLLVDDDCSEGLDLFLWGLDAGSAGAELAELAEI